MMLNIYSLLLPLLLSLVPKGLNKKKKERRVGKEPALILLLAPDQALIINFGSQTIILSLRFQGTSGDKIR